MEEVAAQEAMENDLMMQNEMEAEIDMAMNDLGDQPDWRNIWTCLLYSLVLYESKKTKIAQSDKKPFVTVSFFMSGIGIKCCVTTLIYDGVFEANTL